MSNQENGNIKQLKLRITMQAYQQLCKDAANHGEPPATRAKHIICDAVEHIVLTPEDYEAIAKMVSENWAKIKKGE